MPIRFRKSFKVFPGVKVNMSKGGISFTVGTKGYHLNFSKRGVRQTVGLPGSGLSETSYLVKNDPEPETKRDKSKKDRRTADDLAEEAVEKNVAVRRRSPIWVILLGIVVIYFGAVVLGVIPINFLSQVFHTLTEWTRGIGL
jgi:hypothetical protein